MTAPWATMTTLVEKFDWTENFSFMESYINGIVVRGFIDGDLAEVEFTRTGALLFLIMSYAASAYVICSSIQAAVTTSEAFYFQYAGWSDVGNLLYLWEILLVGAW